MRSSDNGGETGAVYSNRLSVRSSGVIFRIAVPPGFHPPRLALDTPCHAVLSVIAFNRTFIHRKTRFVK